MQDVTLDQLRTFAAVIEHGSLDDAAVALRVTPSAVSQRIKALETAAGRVLLRRTRPAAPTEAGEVVLGSVRQLSLVYDDMVGRLDAGDDAGAAVRIPIVVNGDSLASWLLPALASVPAGAGAVFEVFREDEHFSLDLLRDGSAMAAVTTVGEPVRGCSVTRLGAMRYRPVAAPPFVERWLAAGATADELAAAPVIVFDRKDPMQDRYLTRRSRRRLEPPRHLIPSSHDFVEAVRLGMGWGMLPDLQSAGLEASGALVCFDPDGAIDVPLYWQRWSVRSGALDAVTEAVVAAASVALR